MAGNRNLYGYRQVKPIDSLLARYVLEIVLILFSGVLMFVGFWWFLGEVPLLPDPLMMMATLGMTVMLTLGISLVAGVYSMIYEEVDRLLPLLRRPLILLSGVMHTQDQLPETARYALSWNPLAQISDHMRAYVLGTPLSPEADLIYTAIVSFLFLGWGLTVYYTKRVRILQG
jgi:capsular polysaccharide transport system permease protein